MHVKVLEAREREGGRLRSVDVDGQTFDLGATWFWANEPLVAQLIADSNIETFTQHRAGDALLETPEGVQRADGNPIDVPSGRFVAGAPAVTSALRAQLPVDAVEFGCEVTAVHYDGHMAHVHSSSSTLSAPSVVLALPPALAVHLIDFQPALAMRVANLAAETPVWMGSTTKAVVVYDSPFWRTQGLAGSAMSYVGPLREIHDMSAASGSPGALFGFAPSTPSTSPVTREAVIAQLERLFGAEARSASHVEIVDWSAERFTSPPRAVAMHRYETYGHPLFAEPMFDGAIVWASTETSSVNPGHVEGALAAGDRASHIITERMRGARASHTEGTP